MSEWLGGIEEPTILLVEDDEPVRRLISEWLGRSGYTVMEASSGAEAIRVFTEHNRRISLLVTDVDLAEGISGIELAERMEAVHARLRVILISGSPKQTTTCQRDRHFVQKPFAPADLLRKIEEVLSEKPGIRGLRDCGRIEQLLSSLYPQIQAECNEEFGNQYRIKLRLHPGLAGDEVRFSRGEYQDGRWQYKVAAAVERLNSA